MDDLGLEYGGWWRSLVLYVSEQRKSVRCKRRGLELY